MPRTNIAGNTVKDAGILPISAGDLLLTQTAADTVNQNMANVGDGFFLIMHNTGAVARTVTITSATDERGRTGHITNYSIPAGEIHAVWIPPSRLQQRSGADAGKVYFEANNAEVKFMIGRLPATFNSR
jgi:hypothetical protein